MRCLERFGSELTERLFGSNQCFQFYNCRCYRYNVGNDSWSLAPFNLGKDRDSTAHCWVSDEEWWVTGGYNRGQLRTTEVFNVGEGSFSNDTDLPDTMDLHQVIKVGGLERHMICLTHDSTLVGWRGQNFADQWLAPWWVSLSTGLEQQNLVSTPGKLGIKAWIICWNHYSTRWEQVSPFIRFTCQVITPLGLFREVLIAGGFYGNYMETSEKASLEDLDSLTWSEAPSLPYKIAFGQSIQYNNTLIAMGGYRCV